MKILHTSDWHVGRTIRGRSRSDEHVAVLAEIAAIARREAVDVVLVVGDLFDSAAPTAESEQIVYRALLELAGTGATVIVLAGNHDNARRLQAVEPVLELGQIITRAGFRPADDGGVVEVASRDGSERAKVAALPFLSQRWVVKADDLMAEGRGATENSQSYDARVRTLLAALTDGFGPDTVNLVAAHLTTSGGSMGGGERMAQSIFEYEVNALGFPANAHYVALGHLHRRQQVPGPGQIHYCGSPLQLDFGETSDIKAVVVVEAHPGVPAKVRDVTLTAGRRLRRVTGTMEALRALAAGTDPGDDAYLTVMVQEPARVGLADEVRELFPHCVDVVVERADQAKPSGRASDGPTRAQRPPGELFGEYLRDQQVEDPALTDLFGQLLEAVGDAPDRADPDAGLLPAAGVA